MICVIISTVFAQVLKNNVRTIGILQGALNVHVIYTVRSTVERGLYST